ncbi:MAG: sodium-dependent transporter [Clostridia bacterium]|nr:sodium-dependent transporter [Clostridia bacterium]
METKKNTFAGGVGFILAAAGSAVGLGNLWAFPYKTSQNGGAAFVLLYIISVLVLGFVTMVCEIFIGRRAQANAVSAYKKVNKNLGWCGFLAVMLPVFIICYYSILGGWTLKYATHSFWGNAGMLESFSVNTPEVALFTGVFLLFSAFIIMGGVKNGIEKMSKILMPILFLLIVGIAGYSLTLGEGVRDGLRFFLQPDFSTIGPKQILVAMAQAFYSLSLGMGIMLSYGSYTGTHIDVKKSCMMICFFDTLVALLAGLAIFPAVAHFDPNLLGSSKGIALVFIILPDVFASLGTVGKIVSFLFFAMVCIAAVTSVVSLVEVVTQFIIQKFKVSRKFSGLGVVTFCFLVSIPIAWSLGHVAINGEMEHAFFGMDLLTFFDEVTNTLLMPMGALLACITVGWIIKPENALRELEASGSKMGGAVLQRVFCFMVRFVTPVLILFVELSGIKGELDAGQHAVVITALAFLAVCIGAYFMFLRNTNTGTNADEKLL